MSAPKWDISPAKDDLAVLMEAGLIYRDARKFQEARDVFRGVRALAPSSEVPEVALGTVAFQEGDFETARKHYRKALELNPRSAFALAHLGESEIFRGDADAARKHLKTALELDPRGEAGKLARSLLDLADCVHVKTEK